jgi:hypothetical protein
MEKLGVVVPHACYPSNSRKHKYENHGSGQPGQKLRPYLQKSPEQKSLEVWLKQ